MDDHRTLVVDLVTTGQELMALSTVEDAAVVQQDIDFICDKYDAVKQSVREKLVKLDEAVRSLSTDVSLFGF